MYYTLVNGTVQDSWTRWQPTMPTGGAVYEILVLIPNIAANTTTWQAPYTIIHYDGTTNAIIDQEGSRGRWISIGAYRMLPGQNPAHGVYVSDASGESAGTRRVGADSVKFVRRGTTYAPDTRTNDTNNWYSYVTIRNNGGGQAKLMIQYLQENGTQACLTLATTLAAHGSVSYSCGYTNWASLVVDSTQDVSVVVRQERYATYTHEAYAGVDNPTAEVRVPIVQRNNSGWYSELFIQNAGNVNTNVNLQFFGIAGACVLTPCSYTNQATLTPGGRARLPLTNYTADGFYGSVRVTNSANQPLAVASTQYLSNNNLMMETSDSQPPAATLYAPLVQNNNSSWLSGVALYRTGAGPFDLRYYRHDTGGECSTMLGVTNNPYNVYPAPPAGNPCTTTPSGRFQAGSTMVSNVNQLKANIAATTYAAIANPSRQVIVGKVRRDTGNIGWSDAFMIANYNGGAATVTVRFYNANGTTHSTLAYTVGSFQTLNVFGQVPTNFTGSAVITSDQPIAVQANSYYPGGGATTRDVIGSYPATHR